MSGGCEAAYQLREQIYWLGWTVRWLPPLQAGCLLGRYAPNKFEAYGEEEIQAVVSALRDGFLAPGPRTEEFERQVRQQ